MKNFGAVVVLALVASVAPAAQQGPQGSQGGSSFEDAQMRAEVQRKIADLRLDSPIDVSVHDHIVAVDGLISTLHVKRQIIDLARKTPGVTRVDSTLQIARPESDTALAAAVSKAVQTYSRITIYDYVSGRVQNGVVTLAGAVTEPLKQDEIVDRVEHVRGVRDIVTKITVLPLSPNDDRLRAVIARAVYSDPSFVNYSPANPPIHIVVENGHVILEGIVVSNVERQRAETVAREVGGVYSVDNRIQLSSELRSNR